MKKKILYALLSAVIAFGLWAYVITAVSPEWEETYYNIPVVLNNESVLHEHGLMIIGEDEPKVTLKLFGNRSDLVNLNNANITLVANLANIYQAGEHRLTYSIAYPGNVPNNAIEVVNQNPKEITLTIVERKTKEVPVMVEYLNAVPADYRTDKENVVLGQQYVTVTGPAEAVDKVQAVKIYVNLENQTETISQAYDFTLCDASGVAVVSEYLTTSVAQVDMTLKIQRYKEIQLSLNVIPGGGANDKNTSIKMDLETIQVAGTKQQLDSLADTFVLGELRLGEILVSGTLEYAIKLPEGIDNLTGQDKVTVTVQFPEDFVSKSFTVSAIEAKNVPENMSAEISQKQIKVTVRGLKVQVNALKAEQLVMYVDFANATPGMNTYKAVLHITSDAFAGVGAVGAYSVDALVVQAE
jgi:YbbR domain-containing protein